MDLVTGGAGFIGSHLVRALLAEGEEVRCLVRPGVTTANLHGLPVERVCGDLTEPATLPRAVRGARRLFHCAADYRLYAPDPREIYRTNVDGTRNVLQAAAESGVERVVHTSSVGALGLNDDGTPVNEAKRVTLDQVVGHYKRSKYLSERVAETWAAEGLPLVIVSPSTPIGEQDLRPTPTGRIIVDFLNRKMFGYLDTGMNLVDVKDVAAGHVLAATKGRVGARYILGNRNLSLREIFEMLSGITGIPAPRVRLPYWIPWVYAALSTATARVRGGEPGVALESVRMSGHKMYFDPSRAVRELDLPQTPVENALQRAVTWYTENGYVRA